ncbi:MAG: glycerol acyltransferase [Bacteroidales bacterium]|nr:glycerol acyltransferase [Bacteroidales bacterium]
MSDKETLQIDIEKIIGEKIPKLAKKLPRFAFKYLKKILHQDDINGLLGRTGGISGLPFVTETMKEFKTSVNAVGLDHIEKDGRYIVAANHPIGGLDGIALIDTVGKIKPDVITPVNDFLMFIPNLRPLFIPVNKLGSNADNIKIFNETFAGDRTICFYPFGLCSRKQKGKIIDLEWKKTFITKAKTYHRDIIPTHISGRNSNFFYNLSNIRKKLGIKANIEMLFLVNEFYKQKNQTLTITFGKPIPWQTFDGRYTDGEWAMKLRNFSYNLPNDCEQTFDPEKNYTI